MTKKTDLEDADTDDILDELRGLMKRDKSRAGELFRELDTRMKDDAGCPSDWGGEEADDDDEDTEE